MGIAFLLAALLQETPVRAPELTGRVTSVVQDGPTWLVTIRTSGGTLKNRTPEALLYLAPETKLAYFEIPLTQQKPEAGMIAEFWLRSNSRDLVEFARFARDEKALPKRAPPPPPLPPPPPPVPAVTVEAEEMDLRGVAARELAGASRGKAILFTEPGNRAKKTVVLKKGFYEIQVFMQGRKAAADAVTVRLAGREFALTQEKWDSLAPGRLKDKPRIEVEIPKSEDYELRIEFAETDVYVDRVVLIPLPRPKEF